MKSLRTFLPCLGAVLILCLVLLFTSGSWLIARKVIALLVLPAGAIWLSIFALVFFPGVKAWLRALLAALWVVYSLAGSPYFGIALLRTLEEPYYPYEELAEPVDALVLLGGGTVQTPGGNPGLGTHGDRVLRPAMLYHRGLAPVLITTGRSVTEEGDDRLLSEETAEIWESLGIPADAIVQIPEPRNTAEEMRAVAKLLSRNPEWKRLGLCSSASHLDRALREARSQGLDPVPVPSDFRSTPLPLLSLYLVPQGRGFRDVQTALWEYLGTLL